MGIMKPQQQPTEPQTCTTKTNNNNNNKNMNLEKKTTTTSLSNLSKQSKTLHNQQLLKECQTNEEQSKIPVIRATARLMDFATTDSLVGSSATIPPMRSNMRLQHHMLLRGRSRIRHHRRNTGVAVGVGVTTPCTSVTARYYRDVSGIPRNQSNSSNQEGRSTSATLELQPKEMLALRFSAPCSNNNNNKNNTSFKEKNNTHNTSTSTSNNVDNANDDPPSSDNSYSISSISASSITRPVIRRRFNASLSSTDTNLLNSPTTPTNLDECGNYDISTTTTSSTCSLVEDNNHNRACHATESGSSSAGSCCTTVSAIKRNNNKRSLSSTRIEKDKCDEYNTKLLRKTTPPMGNYGKNKKSINNNNNNNNNVNTNNKQEIKKFTTTTIVGGKTCTRLARTHASCQDVRSMTNKESTTATATVTGRGGSFKEYSTSGIPTATGGMHCLRNKI